MTLKQFIPLLLFFTSCSFPGQNKQLNTVFSLAGGNRIELEKVLDHYQNDPEKLAAARFLIVNMLGHSGCDSTDIRKMQPVYEKHVAISEKYQWERSNKWYQEIDSMWKSEREKRGVFGFTPKTDIKHVTAEQLIREIDRSFKAWKENAYTCNDSFEDFCCYILPYRFSEQVLFDACRDTFYARHRLLFNDPQKDFRVVTDSLHKSYSELMHNNWAAASLPLYSASAFEQLKRGSCDDKAWYNCLMMSALGMGVAIDFVPEWGNRAGGHSWNCLIVGGETYPFEPFWDADRWKYKRIYNNACFDLLWGKFRLPKVYRRTFEHHLDGPIGDRDVRRDDIPPLFRNPFMKDVSDAYFDAVDVTVTLTEPCPDDARYGYLCVFGAKEWRPVQWGKIGRNGKVLFKGMGKDIAYLPMYYKYGKLMPAAPAFLIDENGELQKLAADKDTMSVTVRNYTAYLYQEEIAEAKRLLAGCRLVGHDETSQTADTLYAFTDTMDTWENRAYIRFPQKKYQSVELLTPHDTVGLCELVFYADGKQPIRPIRVSADIRPLTGDDEPLAAIADSRSATGFKGVFKNPKARKIRFDFDQPVSIGEIFFQPYTLNYLNNKRTVELQYWDGQWITADTLQENGRNLTFHHVPEGTLYRTKINGVNDRPFTYNDGIIKWY